VRLPVRRDHIAQQDVIDRELDPYIVGDDALLWCVRPTLFECVGEADDAGAKWFSRFRAGVRVVGVGRYSLVMDTANQRRVLEPVLDELGAPRVPRRPLRPVPKRRRREEEVLEGLTAAFAAAGLPLRGSLLRSKVVAAAVGIERAAAALRRDRPGAVVVANQHNVNTRAVLAAAGDAGVPRVYFPHAPVARNRRYTDLPVEAAGLRGPAEVDWYRRCGAATDWLRVVGSPADEIPAPPSMGGATSIVLALSPIDDAAVLAMIELVASAVGGRSVTVAAHPRMDRAALGALIPSGWEIHPGTTQELLDAGPQMVIQCSSGVAWEALARGLPTIQLEFPGTPPNYPVIAAPYVSIASDTDELATAVEAAAQEGRHEARRMALVEWASAWCAPTGRPAVVAATGLLQEVERRQPVGVLLDGWFGR
jgi:hypothetical protein